MGTCWWEETSGIGKKETSGGRAIRSVRGFLPISVILPIAFGVLLLTNIVTLNLYRSKANELNSFRVAVQAAGEAQEKKTRETIEKQRKTTDEAEKRYKRAISDIRAKYRVLSGSRGGELPPVPSTTPVANDEARDNRLVELFRIAEEQAKQLEDLQGWVSEQSR